MPKIILSGSIDGRSMKPVEVDLKKDWNMTKEEWDALADDDQTSFVADAITLEYGWSYVDPDDEIE